MLEALVLLPAVPPTSPSCRFVPLATSFFRRCARGLCGGLLAASTAVLAAEPVALPSYPDPADDAVQVQRLRAMARTQRDAAEQGFLAASAACQGRFFVNACLDDARAERLRVLVQVRATEAEAAAIERRLRLAEQAANARRREAAAETRAERQAEQAARFHAEQAADEAAREARRVAREQRQQTAGRAGGQ